MAQKVTIVLVDDLDGSEATETVQFALDGKNYEIDLNEKNAEKLRDAVAPWLGHARRVSGSSAKARRANATGAGRTDTKDVREWARSNGFAVSERGRIPANVLEAYDAAH